MRGELCKESWHWMRARLDGERSRRAREYPDKGAHMKNWQSKAAKMADWEIQRLSRMEASGEL